MSKSHYRLLMYIEKGLTDNFSEFKCYFVYFPVTDEVMLF